jgi:hypothetical protein
MLIMSTGAAPVHVMPPDCSTDNVTATIVVNIRAIGYLPSPKSKLESQVLQQCLPIGVYPLYTLPLLLIG